MPTRKNQTYQKVKYGMSVEKPWQGPERRGDLVVQTEHPLNSIPDQKHKTTIISLNPAASSIRRYLKQRSDMPAPWIQRWSWRKVQPRCMSICTNIILAQGDNIITLRLERGLTFHCSWWEVVVQSRPLIVRAWKGAQLFPKRWHHRATESWGGSCDDFVSVYMEEREIRRTKSLWTNLSGETCRNHRRALSFVQNKFK